MSESEEMYLVSAYILIEAGCEQPVPLGRIAAELNFTPVSVNQMVRKLEDAGLLSYVPYRGVTLNPEGEAIALRVLRHRRLWEVFLVSQLKMPASEAAEIACRLEHIIPSKTADRLAAFLGYPTTSPQGKLIPGNASCDTCPVGLPLAQVQPDEQVTIIEINTDTATHSFLSKAQILPGESLTIIARSSGGILAQSQAERVFLPADICDDIWVSYE